MFRQTLRKHYGIAGAVLLLVTLLGELDISIRQQSLSWDEGDHIFAGYMSWKKSDFGINPEHPPLVKALATIPLLSMRLKAPEPRANTFFKDEAYSDGRDFIFGNGGEAEADRIIFRARMAAATLTLLLGLLVFLAAREMFGNNAALFALALVDNREVKDSWFAYFVEPSIHFRAYGIPCKPLPTADTGWTDDQIDTLQTITGTLLISAGTLTGYEWGSNVLNPYQDFQKLKPVAFIQDGVFVYDGTFDMRFASALGHVTRAQDLTRAGQLASALVEAQTAVAIDPDELQAQLVLGDTLTALGRPLDAKPTYQAALAIAKTMEPSAQAIWVKTVQRKKAGRKR